MVSWPEYFLGIAEAVSLRSKDPRTKVGAVIVNNANHIVSTGYNGTPSGFKDTEGLWNSEEKYDYVIHAEANAICHNSGNLRGASLYVTMFPCKDCAKLICSAGISKVFYRDAKYYNEITVSLFKSCGITLQQI
jgi:dCMP deaminase